MSYVLVIDTATVGAGVGVIHAESDDRHVILSSNLLTEKNRSAQCLPWLVQKTLGEAGMNPQDVVRILVATGPGSMTGIKVGLSFVAGMLGARPDLLVAGYSSLTAANVGLDTSSNPRTIVLPATRTSSFMSRLVGHRSEDWSLNSNFRLKAVEYSGKVRNGGAWVLDANEVVFLLNASQAWLRHLEAGGVECEVIDQETALAAILRGVAEGLKQGAFEFVCTMPTANYLRLSTAEENAK